MYYLKERKKYEVLEQNVKDEEKVRTQDFEYTMCESGISGDGRVKDLSCRRRFASVGGIIFTN